MNFHTKGIDRFLLIFFNPYKNYIPKDLDLSHKLWNTKFSNFQINGNGDISIGKDETQENAHKSFFIISQKKRIGFELGNYWIAISSTELNQWFGPVSTISQHAEFTREGQHQGSDHLLDKGDFALKGVTPPILFCMIEIGPQRQKEVLVEQCQNLPLEAKDPRIFGIIPMTTITWNLLDCLFHQDIIHNQKQHLLSHNPQWWEEVIQSCLDDFLHSPNNLTPKASNTQKRSVKKRTGKDLSYKRGVEFSSQLDKAENIEREDFKRVLGKLSEEKDNMIQISCLAFWILIGCSPFWDMISFCFL